MAKRDQIFLSRFAAVDVSVFGVPSHTRDNMIEMATIIRSYSYFSSEHLRGNISNTKLLIESSNANGIFWILGGYHATLLHQAIKRQGEVLISI